jgi:hypothetical protein
MEISPLPVKAIKKVLKDELELKQRDIINPNNPGGLWHKDFLLEAFYTVKEILESCTTYEELDNYISRFYRMSLNDWIESL